MRRMPPVSRRIASGVRLSPTRLPATLLLAVAVCALPGCRDARIGEPELPAVLAPAAPWRLAEANMDERRLDAAAARYAQVFRDQYGKGRYREYALAQPTTWPQLVAQFEAALPDARRDPGVAERQGDVDVAVWTDRGGRRLMLVHLADPDPARDDEPGFALVYDGAG